MSTFVANGVTKLSQCLSFSGTKLNKYLPKLWIFCSSSKIMGYVCNIPVLNIQMQKIEGHLPDFLGICDLSFRY